MAVKTFILGKHAIAVDPKAGTIAIRRVKSTLGGIDYKTITFKVGDKAVSGSFNLIYLDYIHKITEKTVIFTKGPAYGPNAPKQHMKIGRFCSYNDDFDLERIQKENAETSRYI